MPFKVTGYLSTHFGGFCFKGFVYTFRQFPGIRKANTLFALPCDQILKLPHSSKFDLILIILLLSCPSSVNKKNDYGK